MAAVIVVVMSLLGLPVGQAEGAWLKGQLANFDVHNFTEDEVNDFELELRGKCLSCDDIVWYYTGPMAHGWVAECEDLCPGPPEECLSCGVIIRWKGERYIGPCNWLHLGVEFGPCVPEIIQVTRATWTKDGTPTATVPFPWQSWQGTIDCPVWDVIRPDLEFTVEVTRTWAVLQEAIPLESLTREMVSPILERLVAEPVDGRQGEDAQAIPLSPGEETLSLEMRTDPPGDAAALVMYSVASEEIDPEAPFLWVISEALLSPERTWWCPEFDCEEPCPVEPSTWGQIKTLLK
jgi:hypothetical protein